MDETDPQHRVAREIFFRLQRYEQLLLTHAYVLVEATALLQKRLGLSAVSDLREELMPLLTITWVDAELHRSALEATLAGCRRVSLVDHTSFELMRRRNLRRAFAFDDHFAWEGFELEGASP